MPLRALNRKKLPDDPRSKLREGEGVFHFGYIDVEGGCANPSSAKQWIMVTDKRIVYEATVKEGEGMSAKFNHQSGFIPMAKVSFVGTTTVQQPEGCTPTRTTLLTINSSGGQIRLAIPTRKEAARIQEVIDEILSPED